MSQNSSSGIWTYDQILISQNELFKKLDLAFTVILIICGIATFPPACFVYWRILTLKTFKGQYLMKLFVLNGASNMLIYLVNLIAVQFCNWPSMFWFYSWLRNTFLAIVFRFLQDFSISIMWQTTFFISLNRLFSLKNQYLLNKYEFHFFLIASFSSVILSAITCFPLFFSNNLYVLYSLGDGEFGYMPFIPVRYKWTSTPAMVQQYLLAAGTLIVNVIICVLIMQMRKEYSAKMKGRPEQGLLLSSFISLCMHVLNDLILMAVKLARDSMIAYFITLTIAVATTLPFWTMIALAHSMRRAVFSGTSFESAKSTTVRMRSGTTRNTVSANF